MTNRKLILYIACSLDGYIAKPNDDLSFLDAVQKEGEFYGYHEFIASVDTVILGRSTYDWVMSHVDEFPHSNKQTYVISSRPGDPKEKLHFYYGDLAELILELKEQEGKNIFCDGGANLVQQLLKLQLFDELIISVIPVLLGEGTRLFDGNYPEQSLELQESKSYSSGLVQLRYLLDGES